MSLPRVSIVTPSYNQADFLEKTIQSVLSQDYPDLEYFIVDGGSTDGSQAVIERYSSRLAWWVSEKDRGQADAVNKGFARASGEIIGWLNSDDCYQPGAIQAAAGAFAEHPECGLVFSDAISIDGSGEPFNVMRFGDWGLDELMQFKIICQPGVFMRRSVLEQAGYLDLSYQYLLDHQLWLRIAQAAPIRHVPRCWASARFHAGAKNVAHAADFGREAHRIADWMASQPGLADRYRRLHRRIRAGADRLDAHYLLDGGQPGAALRAYAASLWFDPLATLPELRRMGFAAASLFLDVDGLKQGYLQRRKANLKLPRD